MATFQETYLPKVCMSSEKDQKKIEPSFRDVPPRGMLALPTKARVRIATSFSSIELKPVWNVDIWTVTNARKDWKHSASK